MAKNLPKHGIPQGSILGLLLLISYISDIPTKFILYTDDANIVITGNNNRQAHKSGKPLRRSFNHIYIYRL